jgi:hypothetical protein
MNRRKIVVLIGLAALVAGAAVLVYAKDGEQGQARNATENAASPPSSDKLPAPAQAKESGDQVAGSPKVLYDLSALPDPVQRMLKEIIAAAESGNIEAMRPVLESNELKPMVAATHVSDPIKHWKEQSIDGTGRDVLAAMLNMIASGFVLTGEGHDAMYVWPYFAEVDITKLTPAQDVELYRAVSPELAQSMKKSGKYTYYRFGIAPTGVWHYFIQ